ncbi:MAG TPA: DUF1588 domain-containing protein [Polyangiaceae bacterium]|nr:DUF1588 domain-containing protein [Polyangiaceae bacterium]
MSAGGTTGAEVPQGGSEACGAELITSKRIVRLSLQQVVNSFASLLGPDLASQVAESIELPSFAERAFLPLSGEGPAYGEATVRTLDHTARMVGKHVSDNFTDVTGCASGDAECAQTFLVDFAEQAFRRPLGDDETQRLLASYAGFLAVGSTVTAERALEHGIAAVIHSPQFLYRSELGEDPEAEGRLMPSEVASLLAYFVTDGPPDQPLLDAVAENALSTPEQIETQAARLLATDAARVSLENLMLSYFGYPNLQSVVIQDDSFTSGMRGAMYQQGRLFLQETLWGAPLDDLLLSRVGFANVTLAPLYGLSQFPPPGATLDVNQFARIELPAERVGLLTQPGVLASRARPDDTSVVGRGLLVNSAFVCAESQPPLAGVAEPPVLPLDATPRQQAEARAAQPDCSYCHDVFDAYGLALERFDSLGRYRETYANGSAIDVAVTMPKEIGGGPARDIREIAERLTEGGYWARCMTRNLFRVALADPSGGSAEVDGCAVERALADLDTGVASFPDVIRAVTMSEAFVSRKAPPAP